MRLVALLFAVLILSFPAIAADREFSAGEPVTLQPDMGYILVRTYQSQGRALSGTIMLAPLLIRVQSDDEITRDAAIAQNDPRHWQEKVEPNVVEPYSDNPYAVQNGEEYLLTSLKPGTYILAGLAFSNWALRDAGLMITSLCMGTVKFEVKPGVVTDMGALLTAL
ncbi:MAG: hypothetical protein ACRDQZ_13010, partial [Mycobacteriales bacterium]